MDRLLKPLSLLSQNQGFANLSEGLRNKVHENVINTALHDLKEVSIHLWSLAAGAFSLFSSVVLITPIDLRTTVLFVVGRITIIAAPMRPPTQ